jgi:ornithine aminotransferase
MSLRTQDRPLARSARLIAHERQFLANNYAPVPVMVERALDCYIWDADGNRYLDFMSAYSAVSHGHLHPRIVAAAQQQLGLVAVASRAFHSKGLGPFVEKLCALTGLDQALPMNTGAEAVETAIKAARRWGYQVKGIAANQAQILVARGNFHGRTTSIISFSSEPEYQRDFGPFTPGFRHFDFGDIESLDAAYTPDCCAVLVEPIQGEAGIIVPPKGYLRALRKWCDEHRVLLILDEVQSGLGRTGRLFAFEHESIRPDGLILGKALGGGLLPVSALVGTHELMNLFNPGSHGSTFGGNALAVAVGLTALQVIEDEQLVERSALLGTHLLDRLKRMQATQPLLIAAVRGLGLWAGVEINPQYASARALVERMAERGVLSKETHETVIRFAPPLTISRDALDWGLDQFEATLAEFSPSRRGPVKTTPVELVRVETARVNAQAESAQLLMSPPDHFEVSYTINPWMDPSNWSANADRLRQDARQGWARLRAAYQRLDAQIHIQPAAAGLPDLVFTANSAVVLDGKALLAHFRPIERQGEEAHGLQVFEQLKARGLIDSIHRMPVGVFFEGAGDALWDANRQMFWLGYGQRSSLQARDTIREVYETESVSLRLIDPRFYHLDTCFCVLSGGEILYFPAAFDDASLKIIRALGGDRLIEASEQDATRLGVNSVCLGQDMVMGYCSDKLGTQLEQRGYCVTRVELGSFNRSGGSAYCLTLRLDRRSGNPHTRSCAAKAA